MAMFSGDTPLVMRRKLKKYGFRIKQAINIKMLSNLPQMPRIMTWEKEEQKKILENAESKCKKLINSVLNDKKWVMRRDPFSRLIGWIQRVGMKLKR